MKNLLSVFREYGRLERLREAEGLSVRQLERWTGLKRILAAHFELGSRDFVDKQASLRVPYVLRVSYESYGEFRDCLMKNISRGGVFISTPNPLPEVASVNTGVDLMSEDQGMGIRFCNLGEKQQELVEHLYGNAMDEAMKNVE
jgi:hypothetical protein